MSAASRRATRVRLGVALIVLGLLGIAWGVLHVCEAARGPMPWSPKFHERRSYNQTKVAVHRSFFGGLVRAGLGFTVLVAGVRLRRSGAGDAGDAEHGAGG